VRGQDVAHPGDGPILHGQAAAGLPVFKVLAVEQLRIEILALVVPAGVRLSQVVTVRADLVDDLYGQRVVVDLDATRDAPGIPDSLIHGTKLEKRTGHGAFGVSNIVTEIAAGERREEHRHGAFDHGLSVEGL